MQAWSLREASERGARERVDISHELKDILSHDPEVTGGDVCFTGTRIPVAILLGNCVPRAFKRDLPDHDVTHGSRLGGEKLSNGRPLTAAEEAGFPVMVTVDRNLQFQQNRAGREIAVVYLRVPNNRIDILRERVDPIVRTLKDSKPSTVLTLNHPKMR